MLTFERIDQVRDNGDSNPKKDSCSESYAPDISFSLLPSCSFQSLERLVLSASSTWTTPNLPALREISIYCEDIGSSSIIIDLTKLPRLSSFELEEYAGEGLTLLGPSQTVRKVIFTVSNIELSFLQNLGQNIEEIDLYSEIRNRLPPSTLINCFAAPLLGR